MATGGVFNLITNDGKQDRMLMATQMLRNRLENVRDRRRRDPNVEDETPTLLDIERTHILFTNAHFKPFVAIGFEYNKVRSGAGSITLGGNTQFSIPQFGDFFNDMAVHVVLEAPIANSTLNPEDTPTVRWCDYPGERLLQKVQFEVNGNPLDEYNSDATVMHRKFLVKPNKMVGWKRCMGQEMPVDSVLDGTNNGAPDGHQVWVSVTNGNQTPKEQHTEPLEMIIPLLFWFNLDPRLAVPSVAIPYGQRFINVALASKLQMVDVQLRGAGLASDVALSTPGVTTFELYINNIFVNPEIHKIFIKRIGFTLIRVHRQQTIATTLGTQEILLQNLKWPIETLFVGMRPQVNVAGDENNNQLALWHRFSLNTATQYAIPNVLGQADSTIPVYADAAGGDIIDPPAGDQFAVGNLATVNSTAYVQTQTLDSITINAHGIPLYNDFPAAFFNCYTPLTFGGHNICTPEDESVFMVPFNLYPGTYQPSGHINVSRAREFYIRFTSSVVSGAVPSDLVIVASAINFLLISDGSAQYLKRAKTGNCHNKLKNITYMDKQCKIFPERVYNCLVQVSACA
jgi:hypothetical protein